MNRVAVLALSEASPVLIDRFCSAGVMPNLARLRNEGLSGRTRYSTPYLLTPQMWATILTGRGAGSHRVFDYWQRDGSGRFRETRGGDIVGPRLWDALAAQGVASGWINVPMTAPAPTTPGFALSGQDAAGAHASISHPRLLYREVIDQVGRYHHKDIFPGGQHKAEYAAILPRETAWQAPLIEHMARRPDWRFLLAFNSGTAFAQHYFWGDMDDAESPARNVVEQTFASVDGVIGKLASALTPEDTLFIISECGGGPIGNGVRLNNWLEQQGLLVRKEGANGPSAKVRALAELRTRAQRHLPRSLFHIANSLPIKDWLQNQIADDGIDWTRTKAYHRGKGEGNVYINCAGREPHGIVSKADYESLRQRLAISLCELIDTATGERAVEAVHQREVLFGCEGIEAAPDLIIEWRGARYMPSETLTADRAVFGPRVREYMSWATTGSHRPEGLLVAHGRGITARHLQSPVELADLAPTWIRFLGLNPPTYMSGKVREDLLVSL